MASDEDLETLGFADVQIGESAELVRKLRAAGAPDKLGRVALIFGGQGAYLDVDGQHHNLPVPTITLADWALLPEGAATRVASTLQLAMKAAAINCTRQGCQPPDWREIQAF